MKLRRFTASLLLALPLAAAEPGMVFIPGGEFLRGRSHNLPDDDLKWFPAVLKDDRPVKKTRISPFYLDSYEVTNEQYAAFVKAAAHRPPYHWPEGKAPAGKARLPVVNVSWDDAAAYVKWAGKRLPTEAEYEYACRGPAEGAMYPWGDRKPAKEDARFNAIDGPQEAGKCHANYFGLYDIVGNVWEWSADWYEKDYYQRSPSVDPKGPETGRYRVIRGGSWADVTKYLTCAYRSWARPGERSPNIGFRCAKNLK